MKIALATNNEHPGLAGGEQLLLDAFRQQGDDAKPVIWNDASVAWEEFDAVIVRSCWGYHRQVQAFEQWVASIQMLRVPLFNPPEIIRWNLHKGYLLDLRSRGVAIPDTTVVKRSDERTLREILDSTPDKTVIIKPCHGASAFGVMKVSEENEDEEAYRSLVGTGDVLIQSFIPEIQDGEYSAVFIDGELSHVVLKVPKPGDFRSNHELGGSEELATLSPQVLSSVNHLFKSCGVQTLYARLDFVLTSSGPTLMELELIEPYLFFEFDAQAPFRFARAASAATATRVHLQ